MRNNGRSRVVAVLVLVWILAGAAVAAQGKASPTAGAASKAGGTAKVELPAAVRAAFKAAYPRATIKRVSREIEDGESCFEVASLDGATARDLIYRADGTVVETEETIATSDLPAPVQQAITTAHPKARILKAERVLRGDTLRFEVKIQVGRKHHQLLFDPNGTRVKAKKAATGKAAGPATKAQQ